MDLNTSYQDYLIGIDKEILRIDKEKILRETKLPSNIDTHITDTINPFLDIKIRDLVDEFVLIWNKILIELLDTRKYKNMRKDEWWNFLADLFIILKDIFWIKDRFFHIGVGFIILSFFVYFILVTQ
tara:strand:- start:180 stop:560 length:381 start_codon:yes stop_codon:yes gene_type:complete